jgi:hypothetical protein
VNISAWQTPSNNCLKVILRYSACGLPNWKQPLWKMKLEPMGERWSPSPEEPVHHNDATGLLNHLHPLRRALQAERCGLCYVKLAVISALGWAVPGVVVVDVLAQSPRLPRYRRRQRRNRCHHHQLGGS